MPPTPPAFCFLSADTSSATVSQKPSFVRRDIHRLPYPTSVGTLSKTPRRASPDAHTPHRFVHHYQVPLPRSSFPMRSAVLKQMPFRTASSLQFSFQPILARCWLRLIESKNAHPVDESDCPRIPEQPKMQVVFVARRRSEWIAWHVSEHGHESSQ